MIPTDKWSDHTIIHLMRNLPYAQNYCNGLYRLGLAVSLHETAYYTSDLYLNHNNAHGHKYSSRRNGGRSDDGKHQNFINLWDSWASFRYILTTSKYYDLTHDRVNKFNNAISLHLTEVKNVDSWILYHEKMIINAMHSVYCAPGGVPWMNAVNERLEELHDIFRVV